MKSIRWIGAVLLATAVTSLTACSGVTSSTTRSENTWASNPREGVVFVRTVSVDGSNITTVKFCDGSTLVYNYIGGYRGGGSTEPNSPECAQ